MYLRNKQVQNDIFWRAVLAVAHCFNLGTTHGFRSPAMEGDAQMPETDK
jgi:hypothetical protein